MNGGFLLYILFKIEMWYNKENKRFKGGLMVD